MKYSVLIPTLNEEHYIGALLEALCDQTFKDFEVVVVDAASEDNTKGVVESYKDRLNLRFVISPKRGVSFQRNYAASQAQADRLIFFDADVTPENEFISKVDAYLETHEADVLTSWNIPLSDKKIDEFLFWLHNQLYLEAVKDIQPAATGTFIYVKKSSFDSVKGFDETLRLAEDYDLVARMFKKGFKYALLKDPVIKFSVRRLDKEGRVPFVWKNIRAGVDYHFKGVASMQKKYKHDFGIFSFKDKDRNPDKHLE